MADNNGGTAQQHATAIIAPRLFDGETWLLDHCVVLRGDTLLQVMPADECPSTIPQTRLSDGILAPGLIDLQINGGGGVLLNNSPTAASIQQIAQAHRSLGTTCLLPTVLSDTRKTMQAAVQAVREVRAAGHKGIAGIHIEGPFFNPAKHGAHSVDAIRRPTSEDLSWLCDISDLPTLLTLAPEVITTEQLQQLQAAGIKLFAGHTDATYAQITDACEAGLEGVTHLFNAMRPATAREPGSAGAALDIDTLWASIIADGHHVHAANIRLAHASKPPGKLLLVSDAMATVGSQNKEFTLYGEPLQEINGALRNSEGVLAGSAIALLDAVRFSSEQVGIELGQCLRMASLYPATVLGMDQQLGRISAGYRADLIHFNSEFKILGSWLAGAHQAHN